MDGGLIVTRNLMVMREGEVVGHLSRLEVLRCADGTEETEVVLHLLESGKTGAPTFHAWREVGEELRPEETPRPEHPQTRHEVKPICHDTTCVHWQPHPEEGEPEACPMADLKGRLELEDESMNGEWYQIGEAHIRCDSYELRPDALEEIMEAGQLALPV